MATGVAVRAAVGSVDNGFLGAMQGGGQALLGMAAAGVVPWMMWRRGGLGAGDVKLLAALGALGGPLVGFNLQALTFACATVVLMPLRLARSGALTAIVRYGMRVLRNSVLWRRPPLELGTLPALDPVPLAPTIAVVFGIMMATEQVR